MSDWTLFQGIHAPHDAIRRLPPPPNWRTFARAPSAALLDPLRPIDPDSRDARRGRTFRPAGRDPDDGKAGHVVEMVNAALFLRRPLLITGKPGTGKSSLAYAVAYELQLGPVLHWPITSRSTLAQGLYRYDAVGRLQEARLAARDSDADIGRYIQLGPLGTALLPTTVPRVLLIDEIDKSDIDLPNDLLNIFEDGEFEIPELARLPEDQSAQEVALFHGGEKATVVRGRVQCREFPLVMMTNNGEREFPPPFLRRCLRLELFEPDLATLAAIVEAHFAGEPIDDTARAARDALIGEFLKRRDATDLATDQLLNALYLMTRVPGPAAGDKAALVEALLRSLTQADPS